MEDVRLDGKTVIVTGGNSGIGRETARGLAKRGANVILACRNLNRAEEACRDIIGTTDNEHVIAKELDLASFKSVRHFAQEINENEERLDILVNNAGVMSRKRQLTQDGFEMDFGVNHLGHFLLTYLLLDKLKASAPARIVIVASAGHKLGKLDFNDLQSNNFSALKVYARSKTANMLHAVHLAKLLAGTGVTTYSIHPGVVRTELGRDYGESTCFQYCFRFLVCISCNKVLPSSNGAETSLYCCLDPSIANHSGRYYNMCRESSAKAYAKDEKTASMLWDISMELCRLSDPRPVVDY